MKANDEQLTRLLRAAATAPPNEPATDVPLGFETRVLAHWRATWPGDPTGVARLLRRVVLTALALIILGSAAAYRELYDSDDAGELFVSDNAIADSAINGAFDQ